MNIPQSVLNRLNLGRDIGAETAPRKNGNRAWVYVVPKVDSEAKFVKDGQSDGSEWRVAGFDPHSHILGYICYRIEMTSDLVDQIRDDNLPKAKFN